MNIVYFLVCVSILINALLLFLIISKGERIANLLGIEKYRRGIFITLAVYILVLLVLGVLWILSN